MAEMSSLGDSAPFTAAKASEGRFDEYVNSKKRKGGDVVAIFVHAGAGYHSIANEQVHLKACADACHTGMRFLRNGATATEAVEAAIRILEDNDITNAGYGSNLSLDGTVECDASIVDHYGRSGAVGAIGQVMHPIHVARLVLEGTVQKLSLRRVPPNILVGQGATDFAFDHHVPLLPPDALISPAAQERYRRWQHDLDEAEVSEDPKPRTSTPEKRILAPLNNEAQPPTPALAMSPPPGGVDQVRRSQRISSSQRRGGNFEPAQDLNNTPSLVNKEPENPYFMESTTAETPSIDMSNAPDVSTGSLSASRRNSSEMEMETKPVLPASGDGTNESKRHVPGSRAPPSGILRKLAFRSRATSAKEKSHEVPRHSPGENTTLPKPPDIREDHITDTVGAIAVDCFGRIAAASSSGGIGMKHKGRTGPAALIGIGTAVHPVHTGDKDLKTTAAVTSGTGEHMATTLAAGTCADRLYHGKKLAPDGSLVDAVDDDSLPAFVKDGFMGHPSVKHSNTAAAIGVLAVKKSMNGLWFHFAHNTDSFAICSMTSEDEEPKALMSRAKPGNEGSIVSSGGRSCTWQPPKTPKDKRRRAAPNRVERPRDRHNPSSRTRSRLFQALRPYASGEGGSTLDDEQVRNRTSDSRF